MLILGIESSCDETACAIVKDGREVLSNAIASSAEIHALYGGVVPEIASREHVKSVVPVVQKALQDAKLQVADLDAIAVTAGPGLQGALLVGLSAAKALAYASGKPLYAIHHVAAHIAANYIAYPDFANPFVALVASGGHSHIIYCDEAGRHHILGRTQDDAAGEALDKVARALGLGYPGGPKIQKTAEQGDPHLLKFPIPKLSGAYDFSFSGLKTAALNMIHRIEQEAKKRGQDFEAVVRKADFCASFQAAVVERLTEQTVAAAKSVACQRLALAGGVAANQLLRDQLTQAAQRESCDLFIPPLYLCTDNAAMVASMAYYEIQAGKTPAALDLDVSSTWDIERYLKA